MLQRVALFAIGVCVLSVVMAGRMPALLSSVESDSHAPVAGSRPAPGGAASAARERQATLRKGAGGHVIVDTVVDGRTVPMIVDTGASLVALSAETARRLGYEFSRADYRVGLATANGAIRAAPVRLREIRVGEVSVFDVEAVVMPAGAMEGNLLGMSFLNRLRKFEFQGNELVLTQ